MADASIRQIDTLDQSVVDLLVKDVGGSQHVHGVMLVGADGLAGTLPGTGATSLGKAEDSVHTSGDVGVMALAVRKDAAASTAGTDGDYQPLITDALGRTWTRQVGADVTNNLQKVTLKSALGSGGELSASGVAHAGAGALLGVYVTAATAAVWKLWDSGSATGTVIGTFRVLAGDSKQFAIPGRALAIGVYAQLVSGTGECSVDVGPVSA